MFDLMRMADQLMHHEGVRFKPYLDTLGNLTIGVGRNLDDRGLSESEVRHMLSNDIQDSYAECYTAFDAFKGLSTARKMVIVDMHFNMGLPRLRTFERMWLAIHLGDWEAAADEMLDSRWARQVGQRAQTLATMMRTDLSRW